jgi:hypothetical protein
MKKIPGVVVVAVAVVIGSATRIVKRRRREKMRSWDSILIKNEELNSERGE